MLAALLQRADGLLARLEGLLPAPAADPDWTASIAFRYRKRAPGAFGAGARGALEPVRHVAPIALAGEGKMDEAVQHFQQALILAQAKNDTALADSILARLKRYQPDLLQQ